MMCDLQVTVDVNVARTEKYILDNERHLLDDEEAFGWRMFALLGYWYDMQYLLEEYK